MKGVRMSTTEQTPSGYEVRFAAGLFSRVIILRMNALNELIGVARDGKYRGWSPRLVRRAFKREIFDAEDMGLWAGIVEGTKRAPFELSEALKESYQRLMERHVQVRITKQRPGLPFRERFGAKVILTLVKPAQRPRYGEGTPRLTIPIYRASLGRIYAV